MKFCAVVVRFWLSPSTHELIGLFLDDVGLALEHPTAPMVASK